MCYTLVIYGLSLTFRKQCKILSLPVCRMSPSPKTVESSPCSRMPGRSFGRSFRSATIRISDQMVDRLVGWAVGRVCYCCRLKSNGRATEGRCDSNGVRAVTEEERQRACVAYSKQREFLKGQGTCELRQRCRKMKRCQ